MELRAEELTCVRGGREVFRHVNFRLTAGQAMLVTGRNGAGKSSLLRMIAGLVRLAAGRLLLEGGAPGAEIGEQVHYLGHQDATKPSLTVRENLQFWIGFQGGDGGVKAALEAADLAMLSEIPAAYLSAGQRRRLAIARLLAIGRPIWLLDEPTSSLDAASQERLAERMREHLAQGGMIIAAAHGPIGIESASELRLD
ncbi:MAG TPA: heme ABC exporter ATP-binding protein CcmA [Pseudolabrys sp.]|nr:heme ABC exporter ATP-binding protein CcmA [Pseudolabrys sp.]